MPDENVELVRKSYEAWNRGDLEWQLDHIAPDFEFWTAHLFPDTETIYRGIDGFTRFWNTFRQPWETILVELERVSRWATTGSLLCSRSMGAAGMGSR